MDPIAELYKQSEILETAQNKSEHAAVYKEILEAAKKGPQEKKLAAQFIAKYFKHFPELHESAIEVLLDLCEEPEMATRVHAIRGVASVSKDAPEELPRMADILVQLLQAEELLELDTVKHALESLLRADARGTLGALFGRILEGGDAQREKAIQFLRDKVMLNAKELIHPYKEVEEYLHEQIKKVLDDVNEGEFRIFLNILSNLKIFEGNNNHLLELVADQAGVAASFQPDKTDSVERLISCLKIAVPFYKNGATDTKFLGQIATHVLPVFDKLEEAHKLSLLKLIAEVSPYCKIEDPKLIMEPIYNLFKAQIPNKPIEGDTPKINFTYVECLLYILHQLASKYTSVLFSLCGMIVSSNSKDSADDQSKAKHEDFKSSLELLERSTQLYVKRLNQTLSDLKQTRNTTEQKEQQSKIDKVNLALSTTKNIRTMVQLLLKREPSLLGISREGSLVLSWQPHEGQTNKRPADLKSQDTNPRDKKKPKFEHYVPPNRRGNSSGSFLSSQNVQRKIRISRGPKPNRGRGRTTYQNRRWVNKW